MQVERSCEQKIGKKLHSQEGRKRPMEVARVRKEDGGPGLEARGASGSGFPLPQLPAGGVLTVWSSGALSRLSACP